MSDDDLCSCCALCGILAAKPVRVLAAGVEAHYLERAIMANRDEQKALHEFGQWLRGLNPSPTGHVKLYGKEVKRSGPQRKVAAKEAVDLFLQLPKYKHHGPHRDALIQYADKRGVGIPVDSNKWEAELSKLPK